MLAQQVIPAATPELRGVRMDVEITEYDEGTVTNIYTTWSRILGAGYMTLGDWIDSIVDSVKEDTAKEITNKVKEEDIKVVVEILKELYETKDNAVLKIRSKFPEFANQAEGLVEKYWKEGQDFKPVFKQAQNQFHTLSHEKIKSRPLAGYREYRYFHRKSHCVRY